MSNERRTRALESSANGLVLGRREALIAAAMLPLGCARPAPPREPGGGTCVLTPESVEGPFYLDDAHLRSDLREDRAGLPLVVEATVVDARTCRPIAGAAVDLWHCDAGGSYSGFVADAMPPPPFPAGSNGGPPPGPRFDPDRPPPPGPRPTDPARFLRGAQLSDDAGRVRFTTIYPGWYAGRAVHIHVRVRAGGAVRGETYDGGHTVHTGQLFFPETASDAVFTGAPYAAHQGRRTLQVEDDIFARGGSAGMVALSAPGAGGGGGYVARTTMVLDPSVSVVPRR